MKTTYLVWKDPACNGVNPEWERLTRSKFLTLIKSPEGKSRYFIKLGSTNGDGSDDRIVIEATEAEYKDWLKEKRHRQHLRDSDPGYEIVSYHAMETEDGCYGEELIGETDEAFEKSEWAMLLEQLRPVLKTLSTDELALVDMVYREEKSLSEIGELLRISKVAVFKRLNKILTKLRNQLL